MPTFTAEFLKNDEDGKLAIVVIRLEPGGQRRVLAVKPGVANLNAGIAEFQRVTGSIGEIQRVIMSVETA